MTDVMRPFTVVLRNGRRVRIRPVGPDDKDRLADGLQRMSDRSRYLRFHGAIHSFTDEQLRYLTDLDHQHHLAWGAVALDEPGIPGVGVARYVRDTDDPATAESAVVVVDDFQNSGLGTMLLETLIMSAMHRGVDRLLGRILPENGPARRLFGKMGAVGTRFEDGVIVAEIPTRRGTRTWRFSSPSVGYAAIG